MSPTEKVVARCEMQDSTGPRVIGNIVIVTVFRWRALERLALCAKTWPNRELMHVIEHVPNPASQRSIYKHSYRGTQKGEHSSFQSSNQSESLPSYPRIPVKRQDREISGTLTSYNQLPASLEVLSGRPRVHLQVIAIAIWPHATNQAPSPAAPYNASQQTLPQSISAICFDFLPLSLAQLVQEAVPFQPLESNRLRFISSKHLSSLP